MSPETQAIVTTFSRLATAGTVELVSLVDAVMAEHRLDEDEAADWVVIAMGEAIDVEWGVVM